MMMRLFMLLCIYPVLPVIYFMLHSEAKFRKNILLGVTLPYAAREDAEVLELLAAFRRQLNIVTISLAAIPFISLLPGVSTGVSLAVIIGWITVLLIGVHIPYIRSHLAFKRLKAARGWVRSVEAQVTVVETGVTMGEMRRVSGWWFLPPILMSCVPVAAALLAMLAGREEEAAMLYIYLIELLLVVAFYLFYRLLYRQRAEVIDANALRTQALTQVRAYNWSKSWLLFAYITGVYNLAIWRLHDSSGGTLLASAVFVIALLFVAMQTEFKTRRAQYTLAMDSGQNNYVDEDDRWLLGMFYYNPDDKHVMIKNRVGMGTTVNIGARAGKWIMGFSALMLLLLPFMGVWLVAEEQAEINMQVTAEAVTVNHLFRTYTVAREEIVSVELMDTLPAGTRVAGTGMDNIAKGNYSFSGFGLCKICVRPQTPPYIILKTEADTYIFNAGNTADTMHCYAQLEGY